MKVRAGGCEQERAQSAVPSAVVQSGGLTHVPLSRLDVCKYGCICKQRIEKR